MLRRRLQRFLSLLPPTYAVAAARDPVMRELQALHNRALWRDRSPLVRAAALSAARVAWPFRAAFLAHRLSRALGPRGLAAAGFADRAPAWQLFRLAVTHRIPPADLTYQNLGRPDRGSPGDYLTDGRAQLLLHTINRHRDTTTLDDKLAFADFCARHGFPTPRPLAHVTPTATTLLAPAEELRRDLFAKLRRGSGARGAQRWCFEPASASYRAHDGRSARDWPALADTLATRAAAHRDEYVVQARLRDHPALADLGNGALSTVRLLTVRTPTGSCEALAAMFNLPTGAALINNLRDGGLACPVDLEHGTLRIAFAGGPGKPQFTHHPHTGVVIAGRTLPHWPELLALAHAAHRRAPLAGFPLIGWDIALTADGPVLLEANHQVSLNFHQVAPNPPLAATRLPALLLWHLRRATNEIAE